MTLFPQGAYQDYIEVDDEVRDACEEIVTFVQENADECKVRYLMYC